MDTLSEYRRIIRDVIQDFAQLEPSGGGVESEVICDDANGHYELMRTGWKGIHRVHGSVVHIDLRPDGKVWLQYDGTNKCVAEELVAAGIPRDHIVLAFKHPEIRPHTGYATA